MSRINKESFDSAIAEMKKVAKELNLPENILAEAVELLHSLCQEGFATGRYYLAVGFACLHYKIKRDPSCPTITLRNLTEKIPLDRKKITRFYKKIVAKEGVLPQVCTLRPTIYVKAFGKKMGFSKRALAGAIRLAEEMVRKRVHLGRNPVDLAAACLFAAGFLYGEKRSQKEIAIGCGVSEVSIRNILHLPFFKEKALEAKLPGFISKEVSEKILLEFIPKLLAKAPIDQQGIPFYRLSSDLHRSFPEKFKGFYISFGHLLDVILRLAKKGLVKGIPGQGCSSKKFLKKPECDQCLHKICPFSIIQLQEGINSTPK